MYFPKDKRTKIIITAAVLTLAIGGIIVLAATNRSALPQSFLVARKNASDVSQHIVDLTTQIGEKVAAANTADLAGDTTRAEALVDEARAANAEAYKNAGELSSHLKDLANSLVALNSASRQRVAYEAVATELSLVSEFIVYTQNLNDFFDKLSLAIETGGRSSKNDAAAALTVVNEGAKKINALNADFQTRMKTFDSSL